MTPATDAAAPSDAMDRSALDERWQRGFRWVEEQLGGTITRFESQARWRPAWFLELRRASDGATLPLYWRGARGEFHRSTAPLEREGRILEVLERNGVPVPHPYGVCEDPPGLLLAQLPGRFNLATEPDPALRARTLDDYLHVLVRMHAIDAQEFAREGIRMPADPVESCLGELPSFVREYRRAKNQPDPMIEFAVDWCLRNVPRDRAHVGFVHCDCGQFLFDEGRVTGVIDFELAYLGDSAAADLAGIRSRQLSEPLGDMRKIVARYEEISGAAVDRRAIDYHTVRFGLTNPLGLAPVLGRPVPEMNYAQYLAWYVVYSRCPLEVMAHILGVALDPPDVPEPEPTSSHTATTFLANALERLRDGRAGEERYEMDRLYRVAQYLERSDRFRAALDADDLAEAAALLGRRPRDRAEADVALEELVARNAATGERDAELLRFFHRRLCREEALLQPTLRELEGARMEPID
ncbi:MAG: phosphotransferase [Myxococcota bacterium]|nr:phosphotransferase [Myxococcales bacterium]